MQITLYNFNKKVNSTLQPSGGTTLEGYLRNDDPVSILTPSVVFSVSGAPNFNYAFIPEFNRYYWIDDWRHLEGHWIASMSVDVLATYRSEIGAKDLYVLRSSAEFNTYVIDSKYPATTHQSAVETQPGKMRISGLTSYETTPETFFSISFGSGTIVLGVFGPEGTGITYYAMTPNHFRSFARELYDYNPLDDEPNWWEGIIPGVAKSISNPVQYIASCMWYPFSYAQIIGSDESAIDIKLGLWSVSLIGRQLDPQQDMIVVNTSFTIPRHPQTSSRGMWVNSEPYTHHVITFYPFGTFAIDAQAVIDGSRVDCKFYTDWITGKSKLVLDVGAGVNRKIIATVDGQISIPLSIGQTSVDLFGIAGSVIGAVGGVLSGIAGAAIGLFGNPENKGTSKLVHKLNANAGTTVGQMASAAKDSAPTLQTTGGVGSMLAFTSNLGDIPLLTSYFSPVVDEDRVNLGRPLCSIRKPSALGGYMQCEGAYITTSGTSEESDAVAAYLNGGFFYE